MDLIFTEMLGWKLFFFICCPWLSMTQAQAQDSIAGKKTLISSQGARPEIFTNGFIDIVNNGEVNASARFIRVFIGEQGKLALPLSIYSGISSNNFQSQILAGGQHSNVQLANAFINPLSGLINISSDGVIFFRDAGKITKAGFLYHFGERLLTGYTTGSLTDPQSGRPINFLNVFATGGIYFQTAAWERSNEKNIGIFWIISRYHSCYTDPGQLAVFLPAVQSKGLYSGYSLGFGVEINRMLNIKLIYYRYVQSPGIDGSLPVYQFSFNYSLKVS